MINLDLELGVPGSDHCERRLVAAASPLREDEAGILRRVCVAISESAYTSIDVCQILYFIDSSQLVQ